MVTTQLVYMIPRISVLRFDRFAPRLGHMSERFALLTLIVLREGFFKLVVTLSEQGIYKVTPDVLTGLAAKLISNFTNALAHTRLDRGMEKYAWVHPDDR